MEKASEILLIVVSSALTVLLLLLIGVAIKVMQLVQSLKRISEKAERFVASAESIGEFVKHTSNPVALGKFVYNISQSILHHDSKQKRSTTK